MIYLRGKKNFFCCNWCYWSKKIKLDSSAIENGRVAEARSTLTWGQKALTCNCATNQVAIDLQRQNNDTLGYPSPQTVYNPHVLLKIKTNSKHFIEVVVCQIKELKNEETVALKKKKSNQEKKEERRNKNKEPNFPIFTGQTSVFWEGSK